jgi:hypothetical protein
MAGKSRGIIAFGTLGSEVIPLKPSPRWGEGRVRGGFQVVRLNFHFAYFAILYSQYAASIVLCTL